MRIQYKGYFIEPSVNATDRFDLSRAITRTKKQDPNNLDAPVETYGAEDEMGFGMSLENCFQQIIKKETALSFSDSVITINEYLDQYKKEKEELRAYIENKTQIKIN